VGLTRPASDDNAARRRLGAARDFGTGPGQPEPRDTPWPAGIPDRPWPAGIPDRPWPAGIPDRPWPAGLRDGPWPAGLRSNGPGAGLGRTARDLGPPAATRPPWSPVRRPRP